MSPIMKQYLRVFLFTGITYGTVMYIVDAFSGDAGGVGKYMFLACFFGGLMSLGLVTYQRYRLKKDGIEDISEDNLKVTQSRAIESKLSIDDIVSRLQNDVMTSNMNIIKTDFGLKLKTGMTMRSWGEVITISTNSEDGRNGYIIKSASKMKSTMIDYGKNLKNVKDIIRILS